MSKWYRVTREKITAHEVQVRKSDIVYICPFSGQKLTNHRESKKHCWFPTLQEARKFRMDLLIAEENELYLKIGEIQQQLIEIEALKDE